MARNFEETDEGRGVMTSDGKAIGRIESIEGDVAHVKPDHNADQAIRQKLGWTGDDEEMYELPHTSVERIDDMGVHLKESL